MIKYRIRTEIQIYKLFFCLSSYLGFLRFTNRESFNNSFTYCWNPKLTYLPYLQVSNRPCFCGKAFLDNLLSKASKYSVYYLHRKRKLWTSWENTQTTTGMLVILFSLATNCYYFFWVFLCPPDNGERFFANAICDLILGSPAQKKELRAFWSTIKKRWSDVSWDMDAIFLFLH